MLRLEGHAHVQALAPRRLHEALQAELGQQSPHAPGRRGDAGEGQRFVRVEVEDHLVRQLDPRHPRVPGVDLEDPGLGQGHESRYRVHEEMLLALSRDREAPHLGRRPEARVLLIEGLAADPLRAPYEGEGTALEVRQHGVGYRHVVERQVQLGEAEAGIVDAVRMGQAHAEEVDDLLSTHGVRAGGVTAQPFPRPARRHGVDTAALDDPRLLAHDVARLPVVAKPEEHRLAHPALVRPLRELDLGHEVRLDPLHDPLQLGGDPDERRRLPPPHVQPVLQVGEQAVVEAGADLARVHELPVFVKAHEEGTYRPPVVGRRREAADHQLLAQPALRLPPVSPAPLPIGCAGPLAHDPLEAGLEHTLEELTALSAHVIAEPQGGGRRYEEPPQDLLALVEPHLPEVPAVEVQEVEGEIDERRPSLGAALQGLEARRPVRQHRGDLAVEERRPRRQAADGAGDLRELLRPVLPVAGDEPHLPLVDSRHDAIAVVLDLVEPVVAGRRRLDHHREGQGLSLGQRPAHGAGEVREAEGRSPLSLGGSARFHRAAGADDLRMPEAVALGGHLGQSAPREDALRARAHDVELGRRPCVLVLLLDEEPGLGVVPLDADEHPPAGELLAVEVELQVSLLEGKARLDHGGPRSAVPEHDRPRPVFALRDDPFEGAVVDRVVLDVHGEPLVARVEGRTLRHGPAQEDTVELQPKVIVQTRCRMLLDAVGVPPGRTCLGGRLGRLGEVALLLVVLEGHSGIA